MAIVELARIQLRRGRAYSDTGIPQLASGEMAWAIDSQELYIGNGSIAEGSPMVGNTRILTENDININLITPNSYVITIPTGSTPIFRITTGSIAGFSTYTIHYTFKNNTETTLRSGQLQLTLDVSNTLVIIADEYVTNRTPEQNELLFTFMASYSNNIITVTSNNNIVNNTGNLYVTSTVALFPNALDPI